MPHRNLVIHIIQKPKARELGLSRYFTGKPCKRGHLALRYAEGKCTACVMIDSGEWQKRNPDKVKKAKNDYLKRHKDKHRKAVATWQKRNIPKLRQATREWFARNPDRRRIYVNARRAMQLGAKGSFTVTDVFVILMSQNGLCAACKKDVLDDGYHIDHIVSLSKGGSNHPENLQVLCPHCNISKGAKDYDTWLSAKKEEWNARI